MGGFLMVTVGRSSREMASTKMDISGEKEMDFIIYSRFTPWYECRSELIQT
jgi:hypothetical protein